MKSLIISAAVAALLGAGNALSIKKSLAQCETAIEHDMGWSTCNYNVMNHLKTDFFALSHEIRYNPDMPDLHVI